jgi:hypothetical protein
MIIKRTAIGYGAITITDPWSYEFGIFADTVHSADLPTHSQLLGPDGSNIQYETRQAIGFDLSVKRNRSAL